MRELEIFTTPSYRLRIVVHIRVSQLARYYPMGLRNGRLKFLFCLLDGWTQPILLALLSSSIGAKEWETQVLILFVGRTGRTHACRDFG